MVRLRSSCTDRDARWARGQSGGTTMTSSSTMKGEDSK